MSKIMLSLPEKILKDIDMVCDAQGYERSEWIRNAIRERLYNVNPIGMVNEAGIVKKYLKEKNKVQKDIEGIYGTVEDKTTDYEKVELSRGNLGDTGHISNQIVEKPEPEHLWDDYNLMPVYKQGEDEQFCTTFHQKGLKQRVYPIKKFDIESKLLWEKKLCRECVKSELSTCRSSGGHLE